MQNHFQIFSLSPSFEVNLDNLEAQLFQLQRQHHPDKVSAEQDKMLAIKKSADINDAYKVLADDVLRAEYLMKLKGFAVNRDSGNSFAPSQEILMMQMELREELSEIENQAEKQAFAKDIGNHFLKASKNFNSHYINENFEDAAQEVIKMRYFDKLKQELKSKKT